MSLFKEKDEYLTKAFGIQFNSDSSEDENEEDNAKESANESEEPKGGVEKEEESDLERTIKKPKIDDSEYIEISIDDNVSNTSDECCIVDESNISKDNLPDNVDNTPSSPTCDKKTPSPAYITLDEELACEPESENRPRTRRQCRLESLNRSKSKKPELINISTDPVNETIPPANLSQDDFEYKLKLVISGIYRQFKTTYKTPLNEALREVIDELKASNKKLLITSETSPISLEETPHSLKLTPGSILKAIEVASSLGASKISSTLASNPDEITVKMQDGNRRHLKEFRTNIYEPLINLKQAYARDFNIEPLESIRLFFDGDEVEDEMTPKELDMEDENVIDVVICS